MDGARCVGAVLAIIAHAGTCDSRDNAAENQKPTNRLRPVETFNSAAERDNEDTGPEQCCRPAPEYRVKLVKHGLPQRVNKAGEEKGSGQTDIEQLDRKPLLRSEHRFHHPLDQNSYPRNPQSVSCDPSTITVRPIQLSLCGRNVLQAWKAPPDKFTYYCVHAKYRVENIALFWMLCQIKDYATPSIA